MLLLKSTGTKHKSGKQHEDFFEMLSGNLAGKSKYSKMTHFASSLPPPPGLYDTLPTQAGMMKQKHCLCHLQHHRLSIRSSAESETVYLTNKLLLTCGGFA